MQKIFEELQLPGVTNAIQAKHLAQWHIAQIILRPETYTLNVYGPFVNDGLVTSPTTTVGPVETRS